MSGLTLLGVMAHPDDECLGNGGTFAKYADDEDVDTFLLTATRGQRGRFYSPDHERPSDEEVGRVREGELRAAAAALGIGGVAFLDFMDGALDQADPVEAVGAIARHIRTVRPDVVFTFDPFGAYGHPDHVAISQLTTAACVRAADSSHRDGAAPHAVAKLYYTTETAATWQVYQKAFKRLVSTVDGVERGAVAWPDWSVSAELDTRAYADTVWQAIQQHRTQIAIYRNLGELGDEEHETLWGVQRYYRAFSTVNGGRALERDLFEGLR